jgi:hypothetical protein
VRVLRRFPCRTCKTSTSWCRRFPPRREKFRDSDSVRSAVYSPSLRLLRRTHRWPSREIRRRIPARVRLYSGVCFFSKSASTWRNSPVSLGHIEPIAILLRYVPLRPWRKCQKSQELHRLGGSQRISRSCMSCRLSAALSLFRASVALSDRLRLPLPAPADRT